VVTLAISLVPAAALAYVGPGAGIAVGTTALALLVSLLLLLFGLVSWPLRFVYRLIRRKRPPLPSRVKRAVIIGLDGLDPRLTRRLINQGKLPNLTRLAKRGVFRPLRTTYPAMSPVAWSSFATGVNPAKHGIYDFLTRDRRSYMPDLSSVEIRPNPRTLKLGQLRIPLGKPQVRLLRRSKPFWEILSRYQIPCSILRVPITFPPDKFEGTQLSAMCVPDLQGSQGSFAYYTDAIDDDQRGVGGRRVAVKVEQGRVSTHLYGPPNPLRADGPVLTLPLTVEPKDDGRRATLIVGGKKMVELQENVYSDWVEVAFPMGLGLKLRGICRFRLLEAGARFRLYVSPINIDPARPVMPISHPSIFSVFLAKLIGRFSTLGLAEDTWALNEGVLDEQAFLEQAWSNHSEREAMFFEMLKRTRRGLIACVFDGTDRIQHMFMRYVDDGHPALSDAERQSPYRDVVEQTYERMDEMVGRVMQEVDIEDEQNLLVVLSDHGFHTFRRGVNLNAWLHREGYLALKEGCDGSGEWLRDVDWSRTRAFALGLGGIFLNVKGREAQGIVKPGEEAQALVQEIAQGLDGLLDKGCRNGEAVAIRRAYPASELYRGPYADEAPDLIIGYSAGWRASWDGARGIVKGDVFGDNTKAWSGDHCIDPELVPGVLFANRELAARDSGEDPAIADMAPTLLEMFGVPAPRHMDGVSLATNAAGS
jgi:predicted AlkP superfamily phosphohydrolase/phosphomutase